MDKNIFAQRLHEALALRNMKPIELANKSGIDKAAISQYLSGKYKAKQDNIYILAQALNVNESWLMGFDAPVEKSSNIPYGAIGDFSTEKDIQTLSSAITYSIQNKLSDEDVYTNPEIANLLNKLENFDSKQALSIIIDISKKYAGYDDFSFEDFLDSYKYQHKTKIDDIYMHLAKEAQDLKLDKDDVDFILDFYKKHKKHGS